jgi:outer membrane protein OmpA-like peptidoglycan-associated protein
VPGARVSFPGLGANTILADEGGAFTSYGFPEGAVKLRVEADGFDPQEAETQVPARQDVELTITLTGGEAGTGLLEGAFIDENGNPLRVTLVLTGMGVAGEAFVAEESGLVAIALLPGEYSAVLTAPGYRGKTITFRIPGVGQHVQVREQLTKAVAVDTPNVDGSRTRIRLKKPIQYSGNTLRETSHALLDELAAFLDSHPEYSKVSIAVHSDDRGDPRARTQARAEAVRDYLVAKGIASERLMARGYGDAQPIAVNITPAGRARNNRTEIRVETYAQGSTASPAP